VFSNSSELFNLKCFYVFKSAFGEYQLLNLPTGTGNESFFKNPN
jgi:hypothetical protein